MGCDEWFYAGSSRISSHTNRTIVPDILLEEGGFDSGAELVWAYERESGVVIVTADLITDNRIVSVSRETVLGDVNQNEVPIPYQLIDNLEGTSRSDHPEMVPDGVRFDPDDRLHWVYSPNLYDWDTEWYYVLTDEDFGGSGSGEQSVRPLE